MPNTETPQPGARHRRRPLAWLALVLALAALALYAARRNLAEQALNQWLRSHGVRGEAQVSGLGLSAATGRLVIGDPARPDLVIPRAEIGYGLRGLGLSVRSVRLVEPTLRGRLRQGRLSFGALDPLVDAFRSRPPSTGGEAPRIEVQRGRLALDTGAGALVLHGDALLQQGRLTRLAATTEPVMLRTPSASVELGAASLSALTQGTRLRLALDAPLRRLSLHGLQAESGRLRLNAEAPYPDSRAASSGAVTGHAELAAALVVFGGQSLRGALVAAALNGQATGGIDDLALTGRAQADLSAGGGLAGGGEAGPLRLTVTAQTLRWTRKGGDVLTAQASAHASAERYRRGALSLTGLDLAAAGPVRLDRTGASLRLQGHAQGHGAWAGLGAPATGETDSLAAIRRAARGFRFTAPAVSLAVDGGRTALDLPAPVRAVADTGGAAQLARHGRVWRLDVAGGGLPEVKAEADRVALAEGGASAHGHLRVGLSIGPMQQGTFDGTGTLRLAGGVASFAGDGCVRFDISRFAFGTNDVHRLAGRACPSGRPLVSLGAGGWRIGGRAEQASADVPFLQARLAGTAGLVDLGEARGALAGRLVLDHATASDAAAEVRFDPVGLAGQASLAGGRWRGGFAVRDQGGRALAQISVTHDMASGRGGVTIATGPLAFARGGLQPAELSPLAAAIGSPAVGEASFEGRVDWTQAGLTSGGVLDLPRLDFQSPAGKVSGLAGHIVFDSLAPLRTAPGQALRVAEVASPMGPLRDLSVAFGLDPDGLTVSGGEAAFAGGKVRVEKLALPLAPHAPVGGVIDLEGVQLHDLVESSPFGDKVDLTARVSGRVPFTLQGTRLRITGGDLRAVEPGRLSIQRAALSGVAAQGTVSAPGPGGPAQPQADTFTDFAYQAMENLAFSTLEAKVDSRPDGRLGVLFHIVGKHDPPQHQEIRLSLGDLISRKFLGRKLPLPSGTGVDLTLDTTLNLDDLLKDYADFRHLHDSAQVQAGAPTKEPK